MCKSNISKSDHPETSLFDGLEGLGFSGLNDINLYEDKEEKEEKEKVEKKAGKPISHENYIFTREVECPVCNQKISVRAVKSSGLHPLSRDTDFMYRYDQISPLLYDVWVCENCGYAALNTLFQKISDNQIKAVRENIKPKWKKKQYPLFYDEDMAIERLKLSLLNAVVKNAKASEKALICLKLAWVCRLKGYDDDEKRFLSQAAAGFDQAFNSEPFPIAGMNEHTITYLIGELYRRIGNDSEALRWFSRVITNREVKESIKDMARSQRDVINAARSELNRTVAQESAQESTPESSQESVQEPAPSITKAASSGKKGFLGKFFKN